ncbi:hypothetical protein [Chondrinema litorale]|uniref:hypothetical protein n=1 Tax=Chondrinema litorale TaxID=2994555 RepID=UPI0025435543|nr:hypothetical protein [Chondrinema litorale]UZR98301.1 hypothetical protein OQ292_31190 [Chondrinema litorale]
MFKLIYHLLLILFFINPVFAQKKAEKQIIESFETYKNAILNNEPDIAVELIDANSIAYYADLLYKIKTADSVTVETMKTVDKLLLFSYRHRVPKDELLSLNSGEALFKKAIQTGILSKRTVKGTSLGIIDVKGDKATAEFKVGEDILPFKYHFNKEKRKWKIDLTALSEPDNESADKLVENSGTTANKYFFLILKMITGRNPGSEIWEPLE